MKKRVLCFILVLALTLVLIPVAQIVPTVQAATTGTIMRYCDYCDLYAEWTPLTADFAQDSTQPNFSEGHYYLPTDVTFGKKTIPADTTVCLDLNGCIYTANRHLIMESGSVLNIQGADGLMRGRGSDAFDPGRTIWVKAGAELNLFSGTLAGLSYNNTERGANNGGVVAVYGTFNMHDGTIRDGIATDLGGNIFLDGAGTFNMYGGKVIGGTAPTGRCIYARGKVLLANNASIEHIYLVPKSSAGTTHANQLTVESGYTGTTCLKYYSAPDSDGLDRGDTIEGADLSKANLYLEDSDYRLAVSGTDLVTYMPETAKVLDAEGNATTFDTLSEAVAAAQEGQTVVMQRSVDEAITATKDIILDLGGKKLNNTLAADGATVYVKDSFTADYTIADGVYGRIAAISGDVQAAPATNDSDPYLMIEETNGISFHAVGLNIKSMALRPTVGGLYFKNNFAGDSMVADRITSFGVALSVAGAPDETTLANPKHFTSFTADQFNTGEDATSTLLTGILKDTNGYNTNQKYAAMPIYGRAYAEFGEGEYLFGVTRQRSMKEQVVKTNAEFSTLSKTQKTDLMTMYNNFPRILGAWELDDLKSYITDHEKNTLKIMVVGNSHSVDALQLLYEVFRDQAPDQPVVLGIMYYSGCKINQHVNFDKNNSAVYQYRVNEDGTWVINDQYTLRDGLKAQQWDYVFLQSANYTSDYDKEGRDYLAQVVSECVPAGYKLGWHATWPNPSEEAFFSPEWVPQPNPADLKDTLTEKYGFNSATHYSVTMSYVTDHILTDASYDSRICSGAAIMHTWIVQDIPLLDLYRDYTHLSDYGRLSAAYAFYSQLTGEEVTEVGIDVIPSRLRYPRAQKLGDMTVTQEIKDTIVASVAYSLDEETRWVVPTKPEA